MSELSWDVYARCRGGSASLRFGEKEHLCGSNRHENKSLKGDPHNLYQFATVSELKAAPKSQLLVCVDSRGRCHILVEFSPGFHVRKAKKANTGVFKDNDEQYRTTLEGL